MQDNILLAALALRIIRLERCSDDRGRSAAVSLNRRNVTTPNIRKISNDRAAELGEGGEACLRPPR